MQSDTIADMLTRIRNALLAGKPTVEIPWSKVKVEIARILTEEGFVESYGVREDKPFSMIEIKLKYFGPRRTRRPVITNISRISKPGRRVYRGRRDRAERDGYRHYDDAQGRNDGTAGPTRTCRRRSAVLRLVDEEKIECRVLVDNP